MDAIQLHEVGDFLNLTLRHSIMQFLGAPIGCSVVWS